MAETTTTPAKTVYDLNDAVPAVLTGVVGGALLTAVAAAVSPVSATISIPTYFAIGFAAGAAKQLMTK